MDLRLLANSVTQNVNPNISAVLISNQGYTTDASGKRTPVTTSTNVTIQVQAISSELIRHSDALNIEGVTRSVYLYQQAQGAVRATAQGGDILSFPLTFGGPNRNWLVTQVIEDFHSSDPQWSHVIVTLQQT